MILEVYRKFVNIIWDHWYAGKVDRARRVVGLLCTYEFTANITSARLDMEWTNSVTVVDLITTVHPPQVPFIDARVVFNIQCLARKQKAKRLMFDWTYFYLDVTGCFHEITSIELALVALLTKWLKRNPFWECIPLFGNEDLLWGFHEKSDREQPWTRLGCPSATLQARVQKGPTILTRSFPNHIFEQQARLTDDQHFHHKITSSSNSYGSKRHQCQTCRLATLPCAWLFTTWNL